MVTPCPFSKGYRIPDNLAWTSLRIFFIYRMILAGLFTGLFFSEIGPSLLGRHDAVLYAVTSSAYLATVLLSGVALYLQKPDYPYQAQTQIFFDIVAITLLMHACGGITSGLGILLAVSLAAGGLLLGGVCAVLFAAMASLATLAEALYSDLTHAFDTTYYTYAGMLGASFFTIALLSYILARRAEQMDKLATERAYTIEQLRELNQHIIQHMQSGIIAVDTDGRIRMLNESALHLFNVIPPPDFLRSLSPPLARHYQLWLLHPERDAVMLPTGAGKESHVRFTRLPTAHGTFHMIFLEDSALRQQRLQQSKLVSLGRLTASIAHEIRNPLSAISHAAQLIVESSEVSDQDRRLTEIILENSQRMNTMIEDILQLSRRTPSHRQNIELAPWIRNYLHQFEQQHPVAREKFLLRMDNRAARAPMDPSHLKQILDNLCLNALKYGQNEDGGFHLRLSACGRNPCIEVIDHGPGIEAGDAEHLFEPFFTTSPSGTGLGLFISRELAELNQAELTYKPLPEGGTCFRLCLPDAEKTIIEI